MWSPPFSISTYPKLKLLTMRLWLENPLKMLAIQRKKRSESFSRNIWGKRNPSRKFRGWDCGGTWGKIPWRWIWDYEEKRNRRNAVVLYVQDAVIPQPIYRVPITWKAQLRLCLFSPQYPWYWCYVFIQIWYILQSISETMQKGNEFLPFPNHFFIAYWRYKFMPEI